MMRKDSGWCFLGWEITRGYSRVEFMWSVQVKVLAFARDGGFLGAWYITENHEISK